MHSFYYSFAHSYGKCCLVLPACVNTLGTVFGAIVEQAEVSKSAKYADLQASYHFVPVAIETSGLFRQEALSFLWELRYHLQVKTGEPQSHHYLQQRVAVAVQRGNTAAVMGTCMRTDKDNLWLLILLTVFLAWMHTHMRVPVAVLSSMM